MLELCFNIPPSGLCLLVPSSYISVNVSDNIVILKLQIHETREIYMGILQKYTC